MRVKLTQHWESDWINIKMSQFFLSVHWKKKLSFWPKKLSHLSWVETKTFKLNNINCIGYPKGNEQSSIIAKAVNKQNTSKLLLYKLYFKMILKIILKSFDFQCDFDFQITTPKMILILKSSTQNDFAHLWLHLYTCIKACYEVYFPLFRRN